MSEMPVTLPDPNLLFNKYNMNVKGVIHIGAHHGQGYEIYKHLNINEIVFIEPLSQNFEILKKKIGNNALLIKKAVGSQNKKIMMYVESTNQGASSSILKPKDHLSQYPDIVFDSQEEVDMVRLDDIFNEVLKNQEKYNMITVDVQGYELEVMKGGAKTLEKNIDYIYTEVNREELYENCTQIHQLDDFLGNLNFKRVETEWEGGTWGNAFYIKNNI